MPQSQVVGYDLSAGMLAQARPKLAPLASRVHFIEADIGQAVFAGPFDVVVSAIAVIGATLMWTRPMNLKRLAGHGGRRLRGAPLLLRQDQRGVSAIYLHAGIGRRAETA